MMNLGLPAASSGNGGGGSASKRRAVGTTGTDKDRLLLIFGKLLLNLEMQVRGIRAILMTCISLEASGCFVVAGLAATKKWSDEMTRLKEEEGFTNKEAKARLGLPNVHLWNAMIKVLVEILEKKKRTARATWRRSSSTAERSRRRAASKC